MPAPTSIDLDEHLAQAGAAAASFAQLWRKLWARGPVSAELLELCRLTLARLHRDSSEMAARNPLAPEAVAARYEAVLGGAVQADAAFSDADRATLEFAERYGLDVQSIDDEMAASVKAHYGEPGLVYLIEALGLMDGRMRTARCLRDLAAQRPAAGASS
jgi:hypothetical protein